MATGCKVKVLDIFGEYEFEIEGHWDIGAMKDSICIHMCNKIQEDYCARHGINDTDRYRHGYYNTEDWEKESAFVPERIELIYKGEVLEQYMIEFDMINEFDDVITFIVNV